MIINEECMRTILVKLQKELEVSFYDNKCCFLAISVQMLMDDMKDEYKQKDIWYSVYNLVACGFIEGININYMDRNSFDNLDITNITYKGHKFIESIKDEGVWNKTKNIVEKVGNHTLGFIESVAHDVAVESAKQFIKSTCSTTNQT